MNLNITKMLTTGAMALAASTALSVTSASAQEITYVCSNDGNECEVARDILDRFEAANPGVTVKLEEVPYKAILESLPVQLAAGSGPDLAKVTDLGGLNKYYLDLSPYVDVAAWEAAFGGTLDWYRKGPEDKGIYGMHSQLTITGAYINKTLFEQAEVAVPGADATWDDWAAAAREVAKKTETPFPMAMDRSGHRIAGPAISYGAKLFNEDGTGKLVDDGFTAYVQKFVDWHGDGTMARDVWAGQGGASYTDASKEFINGQLVYWYSGSWQVNKLNDQVGDAFDWQVVGSPCGEGGCTGMPGGSGLVGFADTEHPEIVAKVIDFFAQEENYSELVARTQNIPAHLGVAAKGVDYAGASEGASNALNAWAAQVSKLSPIAFAYQGYQNNRAMFNITVQRVTQAIVGELTVDEAMAKAKEDVVAALAEAK